MSSSSFSGQKNPPGSKLQVEESVLDASSPTLATLAPHHLLHTESPTGGSHAILHPKKGLRKPSFYWDMQIKRQVQIHVYCNIINFLENQFGKSKTVTFLIHVCLPS